MKARNTILSILACAALAVGMSSCGTYDEGYYGTGPYISSSVYYPYYYPGYVSPLPPRPIIVNRPPIGYPGPGPSIGPGQKPNSPAAPSAPNKPSTPSVPSIPAAPSNGQRPGANITSSSSVSRPSSVGASSIRPAGSGATAVRPGATSMNN